MMITNKRIPLLVFFLLLAVMFIIGYKTVTSKALPVDEKTATSEAETAPIQVTVTTTPPPVSSPTPPTPTPEPSGTITPSQTTAAEPSPLPSVVAYTVEQTFRIHNQGPFPVGTLRLTTGILRSIAPYQEVLSFAVEPALDYKEKTDEFENQFVEFELYNIKPGEEKSVTLRYEVLTHLEKADTRDCEGELITGFTSPEKYIESDAAEIVSLSQQLSAGAENACQQVRAFYDFVADTIEYTPGCTREDYGALNTLRNKEGDCTEFADLLIALTRSAGIPARFVGGVVPKQGDEMHDWAQIYLPGSGWVSMDATWGQPKKFRDVYFAGTTPDHIIVTIGRNLGTISNKHYWNSKYWWDSSAPPPTVNIEMNWQVEPLE